MHSYTPIVFELKIYSEVHSFIVDILYNWLVCVHTYVSNNNILFAQGASREEKTLTVAETLTREIDILRKS